MESFLRIYLQKRFAGIEQNSFCWPRYFLSFHAYFMTWSPCRILLGLASFIDIGHYLINTLSVGLTFILRWGYSQRISSIYYWGLFKRCDLLWITFRQKPDKLRSKNIANDRTIGWSRCRNEVSFSTSEAGCTTRRNWTCLKWIIAIPYASRPPKSWYW
jgi:hypothetical protein